MHNTDLLTAAINDLPKKRNHDSRALGNLHLIAVSPRFTFISLDELRYINDSDYSFNFSGNEVQIQKILLYLFSCDFYAMYCDKFFRTIENGIRYQIFEQRHMYNDLPNNMVANYIRYVMSTRNIADYSSLLTDGPHLDGSWSDEIDPRFMPASTQYYILYSPFEDYFMYLPNSGYSYPDLCYSDIFPHHLQVGVLESEARRVFASREAVTERQIYHAVYKTWRIAVEEDGELMERLEPTDHTETPSGVRKLPTIYFDSELPLPKCHTNNWWLNLHNYTLKVDDIKASKASIGFLRAIDYIGAFLYTHKREFNDYRALADITSKLMGDWLNDEIKQEYSMLYVNADPQYYLDFYEKHRELERNPVIRSLPLLRYLVLRVYQRTITVKDLQSYYLFLPAVLRCNFVNELFTLPVCDFDLFYPFVVDACPIVELEWGQRYVRKMSFNKTAIGYHKRPADSSEVIKLNRKGGVKEDPSFTGFVFNGYPDEPVQMSSTLYCRKMVDSDGITATGFGDEAPIILSVDTSMFATNPCGFEGICSKPF